jgi:hypothetical protein
MLFPSKVQVHACPVATRASSQSKYMLLKEALLKKKYVREVVSRPRLKSTGIYQSVNYTLYPSCVQDHSAVFAIGNTFRMNSNLLNALLITTDAKW